MAFEYHRPDIIVGYDSNLIRYLIRYMNLSFGLFVCLFSIAVLIAVLIDSYMDALKQSEQYLATLEEKQGDRG